MAFQKNGKTTTIETATTVPTTEQKPETDKTQPKQGK